MTNIFRGFLYVELGIILLLLTTYLYRSAIEKRNVADIVRRCDGKFEVWFSHLSDLHSIFPEKKYKYEEPVHLVWRWKHFRRMHKTIII
jgi:hypothetical protein